MEKLSKDEAAAFVGCTTRTLTNHVTAGRLKPTYEKGKTSPIAMFDIEELKRIKAEHGKPSKSEIVEVGNSQVGKSKQGKVEVGKKEILSSETSLAIPAFPTLPTQDNFDESKHAPANWAMNIAAKKLIDIEEARTLTGLSDKTIRDAIKNGQLAGKKIGKKMRVRPVDLDTWIALEFDN